MPNLNNNAKQACIYIDQGGSGKHKKKQFQWRKAKIEYTMV